MTIVPLLKLNGIEKSFFGVGVLKQVDLELGAGRLLGLVGENGAGKSTLMNILGGVLQPDAGQMWFDGEPYAPPSPRDADEAGVAFIHQELNLFANLTIAENLFLTHFPRRITGLIDRRALQRRSAQLLSQVGLELSPNVKVDSLAAGERQLVEIAKSLNSGARLLILDEPTTSLTARECKRLFELLESLRAGGMAMIYISHTLSDVRAMCDEVVVLRDGEVVDRGKIQSFDNQRLISQMVGREATQQFPCRTARPSERFLLQVRGLSQTGVIDDISFDLHSGEVLGLSGLMGSGRTELARILFGLDPHEEGTISLNSYPIERLSTRRRIGYGLAMLTESRRDDGLCLQDSIEANLSLVVTPKFSNCWGVLARSSLRTAVNRMQHLVKITKTADLRRPVQTLSGGNQQKVVLGKWLLNDPKVLILDEPTRGIDVGAKFEIYSLIDHLAASGSAVLIISSEIDELIGICDRILVMSRGEIKDELFKDEFDPNRILRASLQTPVRTGEII